MAEMLRIPETILLWFGGLQWLQLMWMNKGEASVTERLSLLKLIIPVSLSNLCSQARWGWGEIFKQQLLDL